MRGDPTGLARGDIPLGGRAGGTLSSKTPLSASTGPGLLEIVPSSLAGAVDIKSTDLPPANARISPGLPTMGDRERGLSFLNERLLMRLGFTGSKGLSVRGELGRRNADVTVIVRDDVMALLSRDVHALICVER